MTACPNSLPTARLVDDAAVLAVCALAPTGARNPHVAMLKSTTFWTFGVTATPVRRGSVYGSVYRSPCGAAYRLRLGASNATNPQLRPLAAAPVTSPFTAADS